MSTGFARLLASDESAEGLHFESPLSHVKHHLERLGGQPGKYGALYRDMAQRLHFARSFEKRVEPAAAASLAAGMLPLSRLACTLMARRIMRQAKTQGSALFPCDTVNHAFLMELIPNAGGDGMWTVRIYNSGDGLKHHTRRGNGKTQTMFEVRNVAWGSGPNNLNTHELARLLSRQVQSKKVLEWDRRASHAIDDIYAWAIRKGEAYNPPRNTVQAEQKVGNCTFKCILAYLRNNLPDVAYCEARATLFETSAAAYATKQHRFMHPGLVTRMQGQAVAARAKASRAHFLHKALRCARKNASLHPQGDLCAVRASLNAHAHLAPALYCLFYRADLRQITVATVCEQQPETNRFWAVRVSADASGFTLGEGAEIFASLDAVAAHMQERGFTACTVPAPPPPCERGAWLTNLGETHQAMPGFCGVMGRGQAESLLRAASPQPRYLIRCDPSSERIFVSCAPAPSHVDADDTPFHVAIDIDPYTGNLMCPTYGMTLQALPDMVAAILVQTEELALQPLQCPHI